jgi:CheY-like chemotaxis protein
MAKLVLVDDDLEMAENLGIQLKSKGYDVQVLSDVDGTVDRIIQEAPDVAILDVMFPNNPAGGFDLARSIRESAGIAKLPIILLTGVNQHFLMDFSPKDIDPDWMPVQGFIEKPAELPVLIEKIEAMLKK